MAERAVIFILRQKTVWKMVLGEQRLGNYETAEAASWAAMSLAMHLREEGSDVELRLHDEGGVRKLWPPEFPDVTEMETRSSRDVIARKERSRSREALVRIGNIGRERISR